MECYEREKIIAKCRRKLPYPISFYDGLSDGSLWNVYQKHVVNNIPIDKRGKKAKIENDQARVDEIQSKKEGCIQGYEQITIEEYIESMQPQKPKIVKSNNGCWWRLNDAGGYDWIPDSELNEVLEAFGVNVASGPEQGFSKKLNRKPERR